MLPSVNIGWGLSWEKSLSVHIVCTLSNQDVIFFKSVKGLTNIGIQEEIQ